MIVLCWLILPSRNLNLCKDSATTVSRRIVPMLSKATCQDSITAMHDAPDMIYSLGCQIIHERDRGYHISQLHCVYFWSDGRPLFSRVLEDFFSSRLESDLDPCNTISSLAPCPAQLHNSRKILCSPNGSIGTVVTPNLRSATWTMNGERGKGGANSRWHDHGSARREAVIGRS